MTRAATRFLEGVAVAWDSRGPWEDTARLGLSDADVLVLSELCDSEDEDYDEAEAEVLAAVREKVAVVSAGRPSPRWRGPAESRHTGDAPAEHRAPPTTRGG